MKQGQKSKRLSVRLSPDEWAAIKKQADESEMVMSDYVRFLMLSADKKEYRGKNKKEYREVAEQIARLGNNLNQLVKWENTRKSPAEAARVIVLLARLLYELKKIRARIMGK
jgi:hypothetical protein